MSSRSVLVLTVLVLAAAADSRPVSAYEVVARPAKGVPYSGNQQTIPYEDVLDIADTALTGKVLASGAGNVKVAVERVLHGRIEAKEVAILYEGNFGEGVLDKGRTVTMLCLLDGEGRLRLAADPPKGGGLVTEGTALAEKLIEAAVDPAKAYASKDPTIRLSAAYRLARAWLAAPGGERPQPPERLIETLIDGLSPGELRGRNVNAAARNALNLLFDCDINKAFRYSVNAGEGDRRTTAGEIMDAWTEVAGKAGGARPPQPPKPPPDPADEATRARKLVEQLGSEEWELRDEAFNALLKMGKPVIEEIRTGTASQDAEISASCEQLVEALTAGKTAPGGAGDPRQSPFTVDRIRPFVGSEKR